MHIREVRSVALALLWLVLLGSPVLVTYAFAQPSDSDEAVRRRHDNNPRLVKALAQTVDFRGMDDPKTTLLQALEQIGKKYRLQFEVNEQPFKAEEVKDVLKTEVANPNAIPPMKATLGTVLKKVLARIPAPSGAAFVVRRDVVEITTGAAWLRELGLPPDIQGPLVCRDFRGIPLRKAIEDVTDVLVDVRVEKKLRARVTARFDHVPEEAVLDLLADMAGLVVVDKNGVYYLTSPNNAARLTKSGAKLVTAAAGLASEAERRVGVGGLGLRPYRDLRKAPLRRAFDFVRDESVVNVVVDPRVEKKTRNRISARLQGMPVETALELLADMADLAVVKRSNVYYVTSPANAERLKKSAPPSPAARKLVSPGGM